MKTWKIFIFSLSIPLLILCSGCEKRQPDTKTPVVDPSLISTQESDINKTEEGETPGEIDMEFSSDITGFYPDMDFYTHLSIFDDYLTSLYQRAPFSFSFQVPEQVRSETVTFPNVMDKELSVPTGATTYAIVTTRNVNMYQRPFVSAPVVSSLRRGDLFVYDYSWNIPEGVNITEDDGEEINTAQFNEERFMSGGDLKGTEVDGYFNNWHHITNDYFSGWVFGSYLHLDSMSNVILMQELYRRDFNTSNYPDYYITGSDHTDMTNFYHFNMSKRVFPQSLQNKLINGYIAFERVFPTEISVSHTEPDDMVYLYNKLCDSKLNPVLITTDFIVHTLHILFDRALQDVEVSYLLSYYNGLARMLFNDLFQLYSGTKSDFIKADCQELLGYCAVALTISGQIVEQDLEKLDPEIRIKVNDEVNRIEQAAGISESPLTGNLVDYSLFIPRGHYTINESLTLYFKLMKWFGQIDFAILPPDDPAAVPSVRKALILTMLLARSEAISFYEIYSSVLDYIVGPGDNPTPIDFFNIISEMEELNTISDLEDDNVILKFIQRALEKLPPSRISDMVMVQTTLEKDPDEVYETGDQIPGGFRLVSERFTIDGDIFTRLSSPRVGTREKPRLRVKTWDIARVFGSTLAGNYLTEDMDIPQYPQNLEDLTGRTSVMVFPDWYSTFYSAYLSTTRQLLLFPGNTGIPWLDSPLYQLKNHLTFFASYAELKHDTILYAKQPYAAEMGGFMSYDFVRDPYPRAQGYIEPNLPFFHSMELLAESMDVSPAGKILLSSNMGSSFKSFFSECSHMRRMVEKEISFTSLTEAEYNAILAIPRTFGSLLLPDDFPFAYEEQADELRMAVVADIFTNATAGEVLEVATGTPSRIYMAVFDPSAGRRICIGYTYTYYEFWQPMGNRLNDQQWRKAVYDQDFSDTGPLDIKIPDWVHELYYEGK